MSKNLSKSPVDLSSNFKQVKNLHKNRNRMKIMAGFLLFFLVFVLVSTFFIPKSRTNEDFKQSPIDEQVIDNQDHVTDMVDVNQIVMQKRQKNNLLEEHNQSQTQQQAVKPTEVKVNIYHTPVTVDVDYDYKVDTKKLGEFFSSSKSANTTQDEIETNIQPTKSVQSFVPAAQKQTPQITENVQQTEPQSAQNTDTTNTEEYGQIL